MYRPQNGHVLQTSCEKERPAGPETKGEDPSQGGISISMAHLELENRSQELKGDVTPAAEY